MHGLLLVVHRLKRSHAIDAWLRVGQGHLPQLCFEKQTGTVEMFDAPVASQLGDARVDWDDVIEGLKTPLRGRAQDRQRLYSERSGRFFRHGLP